MIFWVEQTHIVPQKLQQKLPLIHILNLFLKDTNHRLVTARAGNVIGGGDWSSHRIIPDCIKSVVKGKKVKIRNPKGSRPWQHVIEILNGYLELSKKLSSNKKINGQSFNFGPKIMKLFLLVKF